MSVKTNVEEMLVEKGIITRAQLERVKKVQFDHRDKSLTDIMLLLGYTTEAGILKCFSEKEADDVVCFPCMFCKRRAGNSVYISC